ncbi:MAG: hypothetical protein R2939_04930 [Kofleriaceae bacterium]
MAAPVPVTEVAELTADDRLASGLGELDCARRWAHRRSLVLLGGEPGIGKSTPRPGPSPAWPRRPRRALRSPARSRWRRLCCAPGAWAPLIRGCVVAETDVDRVLA